MKMGASQSNLSETSIYNDIKVSIEICVNNNVSNNTTCDEAGDQSNDVVFGNCADINCEGEVNISQTSKAAMKCISTNKTQVSTELTNDIATAIENIIKKAMENATEGVADLVNHLERIAVQTGAAIVFGSGELRRVVRK